ncbi:MAG: hypothetical protein HLUCCA04_02530 [Oceanicaulis sp. HLUCCA04]|nr:MAG: hypothetical protein HLUCCA04_02530 [Oceanicaulis sp. HLUCCA04]
MASTTNQHHADIDRADEDELIDLRHLWRVFRRRLPVFLAVAFTVFVLVVVITMQMTPQYTATASVIIDQRRSQVVDIEAVLTGVGSDLMRRRSIQKSSLSRAGRWLRPL